MTIQWKQVVIALVAGLLLGAAAGTLSTTLMTRKWGPPGHRMLERLDHRLHLTSEQRDRVEAIIEGTRPRLREIRESTREEIRALLTPEQREKFEAMKEKDR